MKSLILPTAVSLVVLAVGTLYQGRIAERWSIAGSEKLETFAVRLDNVPMDIGAWKGTDTEVDERQFKASNCRKALSRTFKNEDLGASVNVFLVCGTARHVTIHTPDWCYVGAGYEMQGEPVTHSVDCGDTMEPPEFLTALFVKETPVACQSLRIFWTYSDDGTWKGPKLAKAAYAGKSAIYKIYLIVDVSNRNESIEKSPSIDFAKEIMPLLNERLFVEEDAEIDVRADQQG